MSALYHAYDINMIENNSKYYIYYFQ